MSFEEALDFLYKKLPMFSRQGKLAYKKDLTNTLLLCEALGQPQNKFQSIHIAGTNGKGSVSHMLASVLQEANYKVGLYTSPHIKSFTERICINGVEADKEWVADFVTKHHQSIEDVQPSFFEITVAMAFTYFAEKQVDIAVIETGLGGRLDSTNVISPMLSIITNIGYDHMDMLGDTLEKIATEKAGIIKKDTPVIISETQAETEQVFFQKAHSLNAPILFADSLFACAKTNGKYVFINQSTMETITMEFDLNGEFQLKNARAVLLATDILNQKQFRIDKSHMANGFAHVKRNTGLRARFEIVGHNPTIVYDVAHNKEGVEQTLYALDKIPFDRLHIIYGCVIDKDVRNVLSILPKDAFYYFTQADVPRAMHVNDLVALAIEQQLNGHAYLTPVLALQAAKNAADEADCIIVMGSFFILETLI